VWAASGNGVAPGSSADRDPLWVLAAATALLYGASSVVFTLLADLQDKAGFADWGLGVVGFSVFASSFVAQLSFARLADRGRTRTLLAAGLAVHAVSLVWFGFAESLGPMVGARALGGLGIGLFSPAAKAAVCVDHFERAGQRLGILSGAETAGLVIGPVLGAVLFEVSGALMAPFFVFAGMLVLAVPLVVAVPKRAPVGEAISTSTLGLLRRRPVLRAMLVTMALLAPVGMYEVVWAPLMRDFGAGTLLIGLSVAFYGLPFLLAAPFGGVAGDRLGAERVSRLGGVVVVIVISVMGVAPTVFALIALGVLEAVFNAMAIPNAYAAMARATSPSEQAAGQGLAGGAATIAIAAMTLFSGAIYGRTGQQGAFWSAAAVSALLLIAAWWVGREGPADGLAQPPDMDRHRRAERR